MNIDSRQVAQVLATLNNPSDQEWEDHYVHVTLTHEEFEVLKDALTELLTQEPGN